MEKTALIEGLASKIEQGIAPSIISDKTILRLNFGEIIGGTQFRGVFEAFYFLKN